ncbi:AraC family transcriptional regulator [Undibacterium sp. CY18W]|uniref:AraC family transcriptional regulator n=1 Tax=Undibacterium hunanense TaxID=2762292 RepID=A0ABR6ZY79_9BURK|nr:AraC family transcriptional regulator [Undibacterium hunanense]MBC3920818.1 AraC family transcriptional regulator [Undibacterium hunanense]
MSKHPKDHRSDWIHHAPGSNANRLERIEAYFAGNAYAMHRHDTYAIGTTLSGVQSFTYRGSECHSLPGGTIVLHPDEAHDGQAGTGDGFRYRMIYVEPALIQQILGGQPLPFVKHGISAAPRLHTATLALLQRMDGPMDVLEEQDALFDLAHAMHGASSKIADTFLGSPERSPSSQRFDYQAAERAREYIHSVIAGKRADNFSDNLVHGITLEELEEHSGRDRWSLSRDFRLLFGTSPYRYLTMRRLDMVKKLLMDGYSLVDAALTAGFTDQSHMTKHFGKAFGLTPLHWLKMHGTKIKR